MTLSLSLSGAPDELVSAFRALATKDDVARLLEITPEYLRHILYVRRDRDRYQTFSIPKRSGGERTISAPTPALLILQRKLNTVLELIYRPRRCVHGFVKGRSIVTNAEQHVGKSWVLNVDLEEFFPSLNFGRVRGALMASPYSVPRPAATAIAQICTANGTLPQGAATSPILANMICAKLDGDLTRLARRFGLQYTRYCDDLTFSSRKIVFSPEIVSAEAGWTAEDVVIGPQLLDAIESNGFKLNKSKSRLQIRACHQEVTGLTVNIFANVPRSYVRQIRGMIHAWRRYGLEAAATTFVSDYYVKDVSHVPPGLAFKMVLKGRLDYVGHIRGRRDPVYCKLRNAAHSIDESFVERADTPLPYRLLPGSARADRWTRQLRRLRQYVFLLEVRKRNGDIGNGTAFVLGKHSLATAAHNLRGQVSVHSPTGTIAATVTRIHQLGAELIDAALIPHASGVRGIPFDRRIPDPGEEIAIVGYASMPRRQPSLGVYAGIVESTNTDYAGTRTFIQVSVPAGGGLSGSPVVDSRGMLVGLVIESVFEDTQPDVPHREYCTVLPVKYVLEIDEGSPLLALPI